MLLTRGKSNAKLAKSEGSPYEVVSLFMQSGETDGVNLCPFATKFCLQICIDYQGRAAIFPSIRQARIRKAKEFVADRKGFTARLVHEIALAEKRTTKHGKKLAVRLNGSTDIRWDGVHAQFPGVQFYDYTKNPHVHTGGNHCVTFSHSGDNLSECLTRLRNRENVAVVFDSPNFPATWHGYRVINGDLSDLRFLDPQGVVVGLKAKGTAKKAQTGGFIQISNRKGA